MALIQPKKEDRNDWQLVLSNTPHQVVLYHTPTKSLKVSPISPTNTATEAGIICPTCLRPLDEEEGGNTTDYFRLLESLTIENNKAQPFHAKRNSIAGTTPAQHYHSKEDDITSRIDGYYEKFFIELRQIGRGAFASVHLCQHSLNGNLLGLYAVKKIAVGLSSDYLKKALQEVKLLESLRHSHIVDYHHSWVELATLTTFGPRVPTLYLLMSFANGGSLAELIRARQGHHVTEDMRSSDNMTKEELIASHKRRLGKRIERTYEGPSKRINYFHNDELLLLFRNICDGLEFLHSKGIMHLDLKPANVLLNWDETNDTIPRAMLSDFGSSFAGVGNPERTGQTGTMEYTSPEALYKDERGRLLKERSFKSDMWSLGMILYEMIFFSLPWQDYDNNYEELNEEILNYAGFDEQALEMAKKRRPDVPIRILELLRKLLDRDVNNRPLASEVLEEVMSTELIVEKKDKIPLIRKQKMMKIALFGITLLKVMLLHDIKSIWLRLYLGLTIVIDFEYRKIFYSAVLTVILFILYYNDLN
ncbi:kinase-like protein [Wallemia mellicola CBS 633.66]|uniref:Kinase-like protein n=1 Tax=Wallemia mellicola (strain ATCC MYA-4683 / CBS 633.66) TaxID=671144 RepID=I4Y5N7_WALMC|nr:kinase-like protein [Wallemia mellicola CBS 633.66]EIM19279.1 kinase-like protein [Wallemia mellicola CBS 633.66]|eukprot:XP_006960673.1 kinase-like protein [Wallemia mellicola CBS 633.66]